jgi:hypothetical protein
MASGDQWRTIPGNYLLVNNDTPHGSGNVVLLSSAILVWRHHTSYLLGAPFTVRSDHESQLKMSTRCLIDYCVGLNI